MPGALIISKMIIEKKYFDVYAHESIYPPIWSSWRKIAPPKEDGRFYRIRLQLSFSLQSNL